MPIFERMRIEKGSLEQTALDLNFYNGSLQDLQAWLEQPVSARVFSTQEKLDTLWQAHPEIWQEVQNA